MLADAGDAANRQPTEDWANTFIQAFGALETGVYVNFLGNEGEDRVREAYAGTTYARLAEIKRRYDPENLFRMNQNIQPARELRTA